MTMTGDWFRAMAAGLFLISGMLGTLASPESEEGHHEHASATHGASGASGHHHGDSDDHHETPDDDCHHHLLHCCCGHTPANSMSALAMITPSAGVGRLSISDSSLHSILSVKDVLHVPIS